MAEGNGLTKKGPTEVTATEATRGGGIHFTPRVDIYETDDELVLQCDMPGVKPADVDLRLEKGELSLHGRAPRRQQGVSFVQEEYDVGDFYRSFTINTEVNTDKVSAECKHGVLTIHLPKAEKVKPRCITVQGE